MLSRLFGPKITCVGARSGVTITDIHNKLIFEDAVIDVDNNDPNEEKVMMHFGRLTDYVERLTTTDQNNRDLGSVCKTKKQIA